MNKSIPDQIKDLENTRAAKAGEMHNIMQKAADEGRSTDSEESERFDSLDDEIKALDQDLVRLRRIEQLGSKAAAPVAGETQRSAVTSRGTNVASPTVVVTQKGNVDEAFPGQMFTRLVIAKAVANLHGSTPSAIAQHRWGKTNPLLVEVIKANEVAGGGSGSGEWGAELVSADARYTGDFITYLNSKTVYNRLPLREIPAHVTIKGQDGAATGYWVGESKSIPVSKADFFDVTLTPLKVAALAVLSKELLRDSSPAAEALIRDALIEAAAQRIDGTFLSTTAASAGVSPAGLLNGLAAIASSGTLSGAVRADVKALIQTFIDAKNLGGLHWVMQPGLATSLSLMVNALGQREFPDITEDGGSFFGKPVVTGDNVGSGDLILLKPSDIYKIGSTGIEVSMSQDATIEMSSAPVGASDVPTGQTQNPVSMFQTESVAVKIVQSMNFAKRRSSAVAYVGDAVYDVSET